MDKDDNKGYGPGSLKRPFWQWMVIYVIIGIAVYGLIYYFVLAKKGGDSNNPSSITSQTTDSQASPSVLQTQGTITLAVDGFSPSTLTVATGTTVSWINNGGNDATVNSNPHPTHTDYEPLNLGNFPDGGMLTLTFDKPGTYGYHNHLNPSQIGTIVVL